MSVNLSPIANGTQFFDSAGLPLNAGYIKTYAAGTSTPLATYTTSVGNIANPTSIQLGADGRPPNEIWLTTGSAYKFILTDSLSNILDTYDNISGVNDVSLNVGTGPGNLVQLDGSGKLPAVDGSQLTNLNIPAAAVLRSYIAGLTMSTAGSSATMTIAAGQATSSDNLTSMPLAAAISKTTSAWALGTAAGGLDTGSISNTTWYHFYLIERTDTNVVDVVFSLSASAPTLPTNYTKYRRIGSGLTDGSAHWVLFYQDGENFTWDAPLLDVNATNPGTSAVSRTLNVPTGINVIALYNLQITNGLSANSIGVLISDLAVTDAAPSTTVTPLCTVGTNYGGVASGMLVTVQGRTRTNTSAQVRSRSLNSDANVVLRMVTTGWVDSRGSNA
jgi:hypothetical protein